eukprot:5856154-Amphidinium_carterae.2
MSPQPTQGVPPRKLLMSSTVNLGIALPLMGSAASDSKSAEGDHALIVESCAANGGQRSSTQTWMTA